VVVYLYAQTAGAIWQLKQDARKTVTEEKYDFRPDPSLGGVLNLFGKIKVERLVSWMSPRDERWREYRSAKRRATLILAARLILKANDGVVPEKQEIGPMLSMGIFRAHARTAGAQKSLAYASYRYLKKLDSRLRNQPERFAAVKGWIKERQGREAPHE